MNKPLIHAIGTAVPPHKIPQQLHYSILESANGMSREERLILKQIYHRSGIECRHSVLNEFGLEDNKDNVIFHPSGKFPSAPVSKRMEVFEQHAADLCKEAANECFATLHGISTKDITHLITFSCTGMYAPGLDIQLVEKLQLPRNVERTCINFMGCYAAINALKSAYHIARSQPHAIVLIAGVELCSLHYQKSSELNQSIANALFGDGAAAAIISGKELNKSVAQLSLGMSTFYSEFEQSAYNDMIWRIGDTGFDLRLTPEVPGIVKNNLKGLVDRLLEKATLKLTDINHYAIHPGGVRILQACEKALQVSKEQNEHSYSVLRDYGNMSSVTILFVLKKYLSSLSIKDKGQNILACAFGPGITMEAMIIETA